MLMFLWFETRNIHTFRNNINSPPPPPPPTPSIPFLFEYIIYESFYIFLLVRYELYLKLQKKKKDTKGECFQKKKGSVSDTTNIFL